MGKNYSDISGTTKNEFEFRNQKVKTITGRQTIVNNQASPLNITDFVIDKNKYSGFFAKLTVDRAITAAGMAGIHNNGSAKKVTSVLPVGPSLLMIVTGDFTRGAYAVSLVDGVYSTGFDANIGTGFNGTVHGVINTGTGLLFFGAFTTFNGNTRNRIAFTDYAGIDDFTAYDTFAMNGGSGGTGFDGTVTCAINEGVGPNGFMFAGSFNNLNGSHSCTRRLVNLSSLAGAPTNFGNQYNYGVPTFIMFNTPYGGTSFLLGGVSNVDNTNPSHHVIDIDYASDVGDFDGPVLTGATTPDNTYYWFGGEFDNLDGTSTPKLVLTNTTAPSSGTQLNKDAGYTSPFAATSGNKVSMLYSVFDLTSTVPVALVGGTFNDFTSQNLCAVDAAGAEYTSYSTAFGVGIPAPISAFSNYNLTASINDDVFGGDSIPATDTFTYRVVSTVRKSEIRSMDGYYDFNSGNMVLGNNAISGYSFGVVISFDAPTGQLKYVSDYLANSVGEIRFTLDLL